MGQSASWAIAVRDDSPVTPSTSVHLANLMVRREFACRLTPDRALDTLESAESFAIERGLLTRTPDCALPSLFAACHEEPYLPSGHGFAGWPRTKWWWGGALAERRGIHYLKLHRGRGLYLSPATVALADPLCRAELARADEGAYGAQAARLVAHLAAHGPALVDDLKVELGYEAATMRRARERLERVGAVVSRPATPETEQGMHTHSSELARWDQVFGVVPLAAPGGLAELLVAGVRAAVLAPEAEVHSWFSWPIQPDTIERLVADGRLSRPAPAWLTSTPEYMSP
jgi:hypothetical protein